MIIKSRLKEYTLNIKDTFRFFEDLKYLENLFIVIDKNVYDIYNEQLFNDIENIISKNNIYILEALEANKTIETALNICERMSNIPAKRNIQLISIGGGIIQDITGFVANILYRGVKWIFIPTTLLSACDSCIGGKTSINYKNYKNLLGTFYPPDTIYICSKFFHTLSDQDFKSGLGEVVKFNILCGEKGLSNIENNIDNLIQREDAIINKFVENSLLFKKSYIEEDEFDKGIRVNLNFAHTFGHAIETLSNYAIPHGTAVAIGTLVANRISLKRNLLDKRIVEKIESVIKKIVDINFDLINFKTLAILDCIKKDKKQINNNITAILLYDNMKLKICHDLKQTEIEMAINYVFDYLK